jgi:hypothetical protein
MVRHCSNLHFTAFSTISVCVSPTHGGETHTFLLAHSAATALSGAFCAGNLLGMWWGLRLRRIWRGEAPPDLPLKVELL